MLPVSETCPSLFLFYSCEFGRIEIKLKKHIEYKLIKILIENLHEFLLINPSILIPLKCISKKCSAKVSLS